jgi:hypothetical protein
MAPDREGHIQRLRWPQGDTKKAWHEIGKVGKDTNVHTIMPMLNDILKEWKKFARESQPLIGPAMQNIGTVRAAVATPVTFSTGTIIASLKGAGRPCHVEHE